MHSSEYKRVLSRALACNEVALLAVALDICGFATALQPVVTSAAVRTRVIFEIDVDNAFIAGLLKSAK